MVRKNIKAAVLALIVGIFVATSATVVYAAIADSPWGYYGPYLGYYYQNQASVITGNGVWASSFVQESNHNNVPAGYMGVQARLFNSSGQMVANSGMLYNSSSANGISNLSPTVYSSGTYYSKGITSAYNGNGYNQYYTFQSPNLNY